MTELFRFILLRPAEEVTRASITVGTKFAGLPFTKLKEQVLQQFDKRTRLKLHYQPQISKLSNILPSDLPNTSKVVRCISNAFGNQNLDKLVASEAWRNDEEQLEMALLSRYVRGQDVDGMGGEISRWRQLYDVVRQVAEEGDAQVVLRELLLPRLGEEEEDRTMEIKTLVVPQTDDTQRLFTEALSVINARRILPHLRTEDPQQHIRLKEDWASATDGQGALLSPEAAALMRETFPSELIMSSIRDGIIRKLQVKEQSPKAGLFRFGNIMIPFDHNVFSNDAPDAAVDQLNDDKDLPKEQASVVQAGGVGDLIVVREHIWGYERGEIGHIQNVLRSEKMLRQTKRFDRTEQVDIISEQVETTDEKDTATTQRFSLAQESQNIVKSDSKLDGRLSVSARYGPTVEVKADVAASRSQSQESANKVASQYMSEVTARAASKVVEKTFRSTTKTVISQYEEQYKHEFDNKEGQKDISGIYQWLNKVSRSQMYNYGKRLLIDIVVPEPAAFVMNAIGSGKAEIDEPPPLSESATDINESNYAKLAARYNATGILPPPSPEYTVSKPFKEAPQGGFGFGSAGPPAKWPKIADEIEVPEGYVAFSIGIAVTAIYKSVAISGTTASGGQTVTTKDNVPTNVFVTLAGYNRGAILPIAEDPTVTDNVYFPLPMVSGSVGFSITTGQVEVLTGSYRLVCIRKPEAYTKWQFETYDKVATAYLKQRTEYERQVVESTSMGGISGHNPLENQIIMRNELKKACISILTTHNFSVFNNIANDPNGIPQISDFKRAQKQGEYMKFLEQAFEWENLQYALYPYFWARKTTWKSRLNSSFQSPDPEFADFIRAGAARVSLPARLGFSTEVLYFLETGKRWGLGEVSVLKQPRNKALAKEMEDADKAPAKEVAVGEPTYDVIPTELVTLRDDSKLPMWDLDPELNIWVEVKERKKKEEDEE